MRASLFCSLAAATCLQLAPVAWKAAVDPRFRLGPSGGLVLSSLCLLQIALTTVPGRFGAWLSRAVLLIFALTAIGNMLTLSVFHHPITFTVLSTTVQSNPQEASEFFTVYGAQFALGAALGLLLALVTLVLYRPLRRAPSLRLSMPALVLALSCGAALSVSAEAGFKQLAHRYHELAYADRLVATVIRYAGITRDRADARRFWREHRRQHQDLELDSTSDQPQPQLLVIAIGESTSRRHMGLYGYHRPTTAQLSSMKERLLIFDDVTAPVANTLPGVLGPLCSAGFDPESLSCEGPTLLDLARAGGYRTVWISNQSPGGFGDNFIAELGRTADLSFFVNQDVSSGGEADHASSLDEKVLPPLEDCLRTARTTQQKTLIVIHLMGAHFIYEKRYPRHRGVFHATADPRNSVARTAAARSMINHYDNAVAYQDQLLGQLVARLDDSKLSSVFVYFSDHGEEVYDSESFTGHSDARPTLSMHEVPFLVSFSPPARRDLEAQWARLKAKEHAPLSTFELTSLVSDVLGLKSRASSSDDSALRAERAGTGP